MKIVERQDSSYMSLILSFYLGEKKNKQNLAYKFGKLTEHRNPKFFKKKYCLYST